jgi:hypothetical protein
MAFGFETVEAEEEAAVALACKAPGGGFNPLLDAREGKDLGGATGFEPAEAEALTFFGSGAGALDIPMGPLGRETGPLDIDAGPLDIDAGPLDIDAGPLDIDAGPLDTDAGPLGTDADPLDNGAAPLDVGAPPLSPGVGVLLSAFSPAFTDSRKLRNSALLIALIISGRLFCPLNLGATWIICLISSWTSSGVLGPVTV